MLGTLELWLNHTRCSGILSGEKSTPANIVPEKDRDKIVNRNEENLNIARCEQAERGRIYFP